jgi:hypothetical protein
MSFVPPDPGSITPPWPIRILEQLQDISAELGRLNKPESLDVKVDVDRAIDKLRAIAGDK